LSKAPCRRVYRGEPFDRLREDFDKLSPNGVGRRMLRFITNNDELSRSRYFFTVFFAAGFLSSAPFASNPSRFFMISLSIVFENAPSRKPSLAFRSK
jgi:hypothetical protein